MPSSFSKLLANSSDILDFDSALAAYLAANNVTDPNRIVLDNDGTVVNLITNTLASLPSVPSASNRFLIQLNGLFTETVAIQAPPYVSIVGPAAINSSATPCAVDLLEGSSFSNITVNCNMGLNDGICASFATVLPYMTTFFTGCVVTGANNGFNISNGAKVGLSNFTGIGCINGGLVTGAGTEFRFSVLNISSFNTDGLKIDSSANVFGTGLNVEGVDPATSNRGVHADNGSTVRLASSRAAHCDIGVYVDNNSDFVFSDYTTDDVNNTFWVQDLNSRFIQMGGVQDFAKGYYQSGSKVGYSFYDVREGEFALAVGPELHVGDHINPGELTVGGGDSHVVGMVVLQNDNGEVGTWNDITSSVNQIPGNSSIFGGTNANRCLYVGGDAIYPGMKMKLDAALDATGGVLIQEYWNGTSWVSFDFMGTKSSWPYDSRARDWGSYIDNQHLRYEEFRDSWVKKTLNGENKFWSRARIVSAITSDGSIEAIKLHTDRSEINEDGVREHFGRARDRVSFGLLANSFEEVNGRTISNEDLSYATDDANNYFRFNSTNNEFINGSRDAVGYKVEIPNNFDSSAPVEWELEWYPKGGTYAAPSNVYIQVRWLHYTSVKNGATVIMDGSDPTLNANVQFEYIEDPVPDTEFKAKIVSGQFRIPDAKPGDKLIFIIERFGTDVLDTFGGNAVREDIRLYYTKWRG